MPRAKAKSSAGLSIELSDDHKFYSPGSKVSGNVVLNTAQDFAIGSVKIEFYGRVKVYYVYSHGQGESHHRGRAPLFLLTSMLYQGYHTHKPGTFSWPFVFEIPTGPDMTTVQAAKHQWKEKDHFIATDDYIPSHSMPPTFDMRKHGFGFRWHAFTEYVLRVDVKEAQDASMVLPPSARKAVQPILVRDVASTEFHTIPLPLAVQFTVPDQLNEKAGQPALVTDSPKMKSHTSRHTVKSSKLETWNRERGSESNSSIITSIKDKTNSIFNSSGLARYTFDFMISLPEELRLLKDRAIPITVDATPLQDREHTTIQPENYPDIRVDNVSLDITAHTYIRFKSILPSNTKSKHDIKLLNRHPVDHTINARKSSQLFAEEENDIKPNHSKSTDISILPGLSLSLISAKIGSHTEEPLAQTFNTYIIAREYSFNYKLELDVAGEKVRVTNTDKIPVRVLAPESDALTEFLRNADTSKPACDPDPDPDEVEDHSESEDNEADNDLDGAKEKGIISKVRSRRSKAQEAAEEQAQAASSSVGRDTSLQFQSGEVLPTYQANPTNFGFRNEIDKRPPRYEDN